MLWWDYIRYWHYLGLYQTTYLFFQRKKILRQNTWATGKIFFNPLSNNIAWGTSAKKYLCWMVMVVCYSCQQGLPPNCALLAFAKIHLNLSKNWLRYNSPKTQWFSEFSVKMLSIFAIFAIFLQNLIRILEKLNIMTKIYVFLHIR